MSDKKRYIMLIACCLVNLCLGSIYTWSVFSQFMTEYLNSVAKLSLSPGDLAIVYTVANCLGPVTMIAGGWVNDLFGPKFVIMAGGILFGGGMILSGYAQSVNFLVFSFGILSGLGLGMAYGSVISTAVKLFPDKRGLMGGIATAVYGISSVILPPVVSSIAIKTSAPFAFKSIGTAFVIIIVISSLFLVGRIENKPQNSNSAGLDVNWKSMLKTPVFYVMLVLLICGAFSGMMVISQTSSIAVTMMNFSVSSAAVTVSILALSNTLGRIVAGSLSDRIGRIGTLRLACLFSALAEICLLFSDKFGTALFYAGIIVAGFTFGGFMGVYPGFTADRFGLKNNSVNYGIMCIGFALAGYFGPLFAKRAYNSTGSYKNAFVYAFIFSLCGLALTFIYQKFTEKRIS